MTSAPFKNLISVAAHWSDSELKRLLEALQRDRSFDPNELAQYLSTKNAYQIKELTGAVLEVEEKELLDPDKRPSQTKPEGSIDILIQTSRHLSGPDYNFSSSLAELIEQFASWSEPDSIISHMGFSYSEIYYFLSALFMGKALPALSPFASGAILDLLTCLVRILGIIDSQTSSNPEPNPNPAYAQLYQQKELATSRVTDKMGTYLAAAAGVHFLNLLYAYRRRVVPKSTALQPVAPLCVYGTVEYPKTIKAARHMVHSITEMFKDVWALPSFPAQSSQNSSKLKIPPSVLKRLAAYNLNPFGFSMELIGPFQSLLDNFINSTRLLLDYLPDFVKLMPNLTPLTPSYLVERQRKPVMKRKRIYDQTDMDEDEEVETSLEKDVSDSIQDDKDGHTSSETVIVRPLHEGRWRTSKYFVRVLDPNEDKSVLKKINQMVLVQETTKTPNRKKK